MEYVYKTEEKKRDGIRSTSKSFVNYAEKVYILYYIRDTEG